MRNGALGPDPQAVRFQSMWPWQVHQARLSANTLPEGFVVVGPVGHFKRLLCDRRPDVVRMIVI
ncbi:hypothetical protein ACS33_08345 [Edwardsiella ictaluri]|nr:hypothetical protein B6E78_00635 [Edwardsiella ictaluri]KMQ77423.1 hypothetical protein ABY58_14690 [Edwardsiella ictaluri]KMQ78411.1 hypothetical protein ABY58_08710 [Edwardsiella ictaluri]KOO54164.1 hypothetical protein ACS33_15675 [Edwardsiella ictaluri]KOO55262.1 hypothetical protein ACS33_08345 [Edwardsiella ictaluri]